VLTHTSIPQLYLAGFIPGFTLAGLFMLTIFIACLVRRDWGGIAVETSWPERIRSLPALLPPLGIFVIVIGSIYAGIATPTESAAFGVLAALALAAWNRQLKLSVLKVAIEGTMRTTSMILLIFIAAFFLNVVIAAVGLTTEINRLILELELSPLGTLFVVIVFYLVLGCFMETLAMMITTIPIIAPVMFALGFDPVWFGIIIILLIETAMITPPVGVNLYIVQGIRGEGPLLDVIVGALPFVVALIVMIGFIVAFPEIALWLPKVLGD
jgi:tripartite ATP-independent transporter DctM subunit